MATSTTTAIQLEELRPSVATQRTGADRTRDPAEDSSTDPVLEASQLADSQVPEGGYGWVVLAGCAAITWWFVGLSYSWGVFQGALVTNGLASPAVLAFVGSLGPGLMSTFALVSSRIVRLLGTQKTGLLSISLLGLAQILNSFTVNNVGALFVTGGIIMGIGQGLCFMLVSVTPAQYFKKRRGIANGIVFAGGGLGGAAISTCTDALVRNVGIEWTFRVIGFTILATGLPAAWLIRERTPIRVGGFVEWRLFKDPNFLLVLAAGAVATFPLMVPAFFLPLYATSLGMSSATGAGLLAGFNLSSAVGRIICGFLCDRIGPLNTLFISLMTTALSILAMWPESTTLAPLAIFVVVNGLGNGGFFSTMPTVVGNVFGSARVAVAMGMIVTSWVGGYMLGPPIAGWLLDAYGGHEAGFQAYKPAMYYAGSMALGAAGFVELVRLRKSRSVFAKL